MEQYQITVNNFSLALAPLNLQEVFFCDSSYWYVSVQDWVKILSKTRSNMPKFLEDRFDCDKYAFVTAARVVLESYLNTCAVCIGNSPFGYHAWNVCLTPEGLYYFEPQTGNFWPVIGGTAAYKPDRVITI